LKPLPANLSGMVLSVPLDTAASAPIKEFVFRAVAAPFLHDGHVRQHLDFSFGLASSLENQ
ncbi:MAG: hypothetical protein R3224_01735, partial [Balneolaceae bacterium]|nr:hypothetical protein [Balneolaceae bacterium]